MNSLILKISLLFLLTSCDSSHNDKNVSRNNPGINDGRNQLQFVEVMDNITAKLNLPNLKEGVDSFEMRVWCPMSTNLQNVITIKYIYSHWDITETFVWESYPDRELKRNDTINHLIEVIIDSSKSKIIVPKVNTEKFIDTLLNKFLKNFPKRSEIEGSFAIGTDSYRYIFEIAEKGKYQMLDYDCGGSITDKIEAHNKLRDFLNFLRRQLNDKIPNCN